MGSNAHRYTDKATTVHAYRDEFQVVCPNCSSAALITFKNPYFPGQGRLSCESCHYMKVTQDLIRYNISIRRYCDHCGKQFEKIIPNAKSKVDEITIPCPHCGTTRTYKPKHEAILLTYDSNGAVCDPVFNLPLWFQSTVKGNLFWATNRRHLRDIRSYIEAKLRERNTPHFMTMVERLPNFIKAAKNREEVLKAIDRLLKT